jgi:hypothetical protein
MDEPLHATLALWGNFYQITGTAAAALTGLQFVVQTLIAGNANRRVAGEDPEAVISAFGTPTVVHFSVALIISALLCVPWPDAAWLRAIIDVLGLSSLTYAAVVLRRARRQEGYAPVFEDWLWHIVMPGVAYATVLASGLLLGRGAVAPLFMLAAATLLLICVGIHNAWDTVAYLSAHVLRPTTPGAPSAKPNPRKESRRRR